MVSPFRPEGSAVTSSYSFSGTCEHVLVRACNNNPSFAVVGDFLSEDLSMGRVGVSRGERAVFITEQLMVERRGLSGTGNMADLGGGIVVAINVGPDMVTFDVASVGVTLSRDSNSVNISITNNSAVSETCGLCGTRSGQLLFSDNERIANIMNRTMVAMFANSYLVPANQQVLRDARRECGKLYSRSLSCCQLNSLFLQRSWTMTQS